jgi:hypothetical protein
MEKSNLRKLNYVESNSMRLKSFGDNVSVRLGKVLELI